MGNHKFREAALFGATQYTSNQAQEVTHKAPLISNSTASLQIENSINQKEEIEKVSLFVDL